MRIHFLTVAAIAAATVASESLRTPPTSGVGTPPGGGLVSAVDGLRAAQDRTEARVASLESYSPPVGTVVAFAGATVPRGWLPCDGSELAESDAPELFDAIGTSWGGDGTMKTFRVPDLRGRFLRGVDGGSGRDPDADARPEISTGGAKGNAVGSVQEDAFKSHRHYQTVVQDGGGADEWGTQRSKPNHGQVPTYNHTTEAGGTETRPKNAYVHWIIKAR